MPTVFCAVACCCCLCLLQAFVDFENYEEAVKAMREKDHKVFNEKFGDRYVRLIQVGAQLHRLAAHCRQQAGKMLWRLPAPSESSSSRRSTSSSLLCQWDAVTRCCSRIQAMVSYCCCACSLTSLHTSPVVAAACLTPHPCAGVAQGDAGHARAAFWRRGHPQGQGHPLQGRRRRRAQVLLRLQDQARGRELHHAR